MTDEVKVERPELRLGMTLAFEYGGWVLKVSEGQYKTFDRKLSPEEAFKVARKLGPDVLVAVQRVIAQNAVYLRQQADLSRERERKQAADGAARAFDAEQTAREAEAAAALLVEG